MILPLMKTSTKDFSVKKYLCLDPWSWLITESSWMFNVSHIFCNISTSFHIYRQIKVKMWYVSIELWIRKQKKIIVKTLLINDQVLSWTVLGKCIHFNHTINAYYMYRLDNPHLSIVIAFLYLWCSGVVHNSNPDQ